MFGIALHEALALAGAVCGVISIGGVTALLVRELRTPAPTEEEGFTEADDTPIPYAPTHTCDTSALPERIQVVSDRPVNGRALYVLRAVCDLLYGPQLGAVAYDRMVAGIAADEARDIDAVIERLGGAS